MINLTTFVLVISIIMLLVGFGLERVQRNFVLKTTQTARIGGDAIQEMRYRKTADCCEKWSTYLLATGMIGLCGSSVLIALS